MRFVMCGLIALVLSASCAGWCQSITLDTQGLTVKSALDSMFKDSNKTYSLDPQVDPSAALDEVNLVDVPFDIALRHILKTANLDFRADGQKYAISAMTASPPAAVQPAAVTQPVEQKKDNTAEVGMTRSAVRSLLGAPTRVGTGASSGNEVYYYSDRTIAFTEGRVTTVELTTPTTLHLKLSDKPIPYVEAMKARSNHQVTGAASASRRSPAIQHVSSARASLLRRHTAAVQAIARYASSRASTCKTSCGSGCGCGCGGRSQCATKKR